MTKFRTRHRNQHNILKTIGYILGIFFVYAVLLSPINVDARSEKSLKVTTIDVGQGDSILLESDGEYMLIDGGPEEAGSTVTAYLKSRGITKLDYLVLTHTHNDHVGGLIDVIEHIEVGRLIETGRRCKVELYLEFKALIEEYEIPVSIPKIGSSFNFGTAEITYLGPNGTDYDRLNDTSIVLKVENGDNSFLLTGDAEEFAEKEMIEKGYDLKADVLKVGHHGLTTSSSQAFIDAVDPSISVISNSLDNNGGIPVFDTIRKLYNSNIYTTEFNGNVTLESNGTEITVDDEPYAYAHDKIDEKTEVVTSTEKMETANLSHLTVFPSNGIIHLNNDDVEISYDQIINDELTMYFWADYGISSLDKIEVAYVNSNSDQKVNKLNWMAITGTEITMKENFTGCIYVRYRNKLGNSVIRKTDGFTLKVEKPTECTVNTNVGGLFLVEVGAKNLYNTKTTKAVNLKFSADYGDSGVRNTEYMLVKKGAAFNPNGSWKTGKELQIAKDFTGIVYVKFTSALGNVTIKKTTGLSYVAQAPTKAKVKSIKSTIKFMNGKSTAKKVVKVKNKITLKFSAVFGGSGKKSIEYLCVKKGEKVNKSSKWIEGKKVVLKKGFKGKVYVRFTDINGKSITQKTNTISVK